MLSTKHAWCRAAALVFVVVLQACGGGSGGETPATPATPVPASLTVSTADTAEAGVAQAFGSSASAAAGLRFDWTFGDGTTSTAAAPMHAYANGGDYDVTLRISNSAGASREATARVSVNRVAPLAGLRCTQPASSGWCTVSPPAGGLSGEALWFVDANNGWRVGSFGDVSRTRDGGRTWTALDSGFAGRLHSVAFHNLNDGYALGFDGAFLRTRDGGNRWDVVRYDNLSSLRILGATGVLLRGFVGRATSALPFNVVSADNGVTFQDIGGLPTSSPGGVLWTLGSPPPATSLAGRAPIRRSTDGGQSFVTSFADSQRAVIEMVAFGDDALLVRWEVDPSNPNPALRPAFSSLTLDGGRSWAPFTPQGLPASRGSFVTASDAGGWALMRTDGGYFASTDFGRTFAPFASPQPFLAGYGALLVDSVRLSSDRGATWRALPARLENSPDGMQRFPGDVLAIRTGSGRYLSSDLGATWKPITPGASEPPATSYFVALSPLRLLRVAGWDRVEQSGDGGRSWQGVTVEPELAGSHLGDFQFVDDTTGWLESSAAGFEDGPLWRTADGGRNWARTTTAIGKASFINATRGFASVAGSLVSTQDGGQTWQPIVPAGSLPPPNACTAERLFVDRPSFSPGRIQTLHFFNLDEGVVIDDWGNTWTTSDSGRSCVRRSRVEPGYAVRDVVSLAGAGPRGLWAIASDGAVQRSDDRGLTWRTPNLPNLTRGGTWTVVHFADERHGWLLGAHGDVAATRDGGQTWQMQRTILWNGARRIRSIDSRTVWMLSDGVLIGTGTGGN